MYDGLAPAILSAASLHRLADAAAAISSTLELHALFQTVVRLSCEIARAESGTLFLHDGVRGKLLAVAGLGHRKDSLVGREFDSALGIPSLAVRGGKTVHVPDARKNPRFHREIDAIGNLQTQALIAVPLVQQGQVMGVVEVANRLDERRFSEHDLGALQILAAMAAGAIQNARQHAELRRKFEGLRESACPRPEIIGDSPGLSEVLRLCNRVAGSNATALILGETGTGKELIARYIHGVSRRSGEAFVAINCAALPETLLESELFGHEKGSFTSASSRRAGRFELADKGTLFLDEIGEVSRSTQAKLLRVLQEREFVRVGGTETIRCNVRILAATNRNLKHMMADGLFRDDLYYRLSVFPIHIKPLRERREDIPKLVNHFVAKAARECGLPNMTVAPKTMNLLTQYEWRGNVRELQNVMERAVLLCDADSLLPSHLPEDIQALRQYDASADAPATLHGQERILIERALDQCGWNQSRAARSLGVTRYHLRLRMKRLNIRQEEGRSALIDKAAIR